jgi:hypothetical protein
MFPKRVDSGQIFDIGWPNGKSKTDFLSLDKVSEKLYNESLYSPPENYGSCIPFLQPFFGPIKAGLKK